MSDLIAVGVSQELSRSLSPVMRGTERPGRDKAKYICTLVNKFQRMHDDPDT